MARPPAQITVLDIILAVDGDRALKDCVLGLKGCSDRNPCPLHPQWAIERKRIRSMFERTTLEHLSRSSLRLANE